MKVIVTGATGLIGTLLGIRLVQQGHSVVVVSTRKSEAQALLPFPCEVVGWDDISKVTQGEYALVHLAGVSVAEKRWTPVQKKVILESRTLRTQELLSNLASPPNVFIAASAIGCYGDTNDDICTEATPFAKDFLADVVQQWESAHANHSQIKSSRSVTLRLGVVFGRGGFLEKIRPVFELGLGGRLGSGKQWISWIHIEDAVRMILHALQHTAVTGVFNAVAPKPLRNSDFTNAFAHALGVRTAFAVPAIALKVAMGEMSCLALQGQNVSSAKIAHTGFAFKFPDIASALDDLIKSNHIPSSEFYSQQWLPQAPVKLFPYFSDAKNLEAITPDFLNFKIKSVSDPVMQSGTTIKYALKMYGVPFQWTTEILNWNPPTVFTDNQISGPYALWHHTHALEALGHGTLMTDRVLYKLPMGRIGALFGGFFVRRNVTKIFAHRRAVLHASLR